MHICTRYCFHVIFQSLKMSKYPFGLHGIIMFLCALLNLYFILILDVLKVAVTNKVKVLQNLKLLQKPFTLYCKM